SIGGVGIAAVIAYLSSAAYNYLLGIALFGAIVTWIVILATHLRFRRRYSREKQQGLSVRAPFAPYLQWAALALLFGVLVTMGLDREFWNSSIIVGVPWLMLLSAAYVLLRRRQRQAVAP